MARLGRATRHRTVLFQMARPSRAMTMWGGGTVYRKLPCSARIRHDTGRRSERLA
jgi:hypothetical protein